MRLAAATVWRLGGGVSEDAFGGASSVSGSNSVGSESREIVRPRGPRRIGRGDTRAAKMHLAAAKRHSAGANPKRPGVDDETVRQRGPRRIGSDSMAAVRRGRRDRRTKRAAAAAPATV